MDALGRFGWLYGRAGRTTLLAVIPNGVRNLSVVGRGWGGERFLGFASE
jgi:hypothetical protein